MKNRRNQSTLALEKMQKLMYKSTHILPISPTIIPNISKHKYTEGEDVAEAVGFLGEPVWDEGAHRAGGERAELWVAGGRPVRRQERTAPKIQPHLWEGARASARRQTSSWIRQHCVLHRRDVAEAAAPACLLLRPIPGSFLDRLHRQEGTFLSRSS